MKKFLFLIALIAMTVCCGTASAQSNPNFGLKLAGGIANVTDGSESIGPKFGLQLGGTMTYNFSTSFAVQPELLYTMNGATSEDDFDFTFSYLQLPILVKYYFSSCDIYIGPYFGVNLSSEVEYKGVSADTEIETMDMGMIFGFEYFLSNKFSLEARYSLGLADITDGGDINNIGILFGLNYYFK